MGQEARVERQVGGGPTPGAFAGEGQPVYAVHPDACLPVDLRRAGMRASEDVYLPALGGQALGQLGE